MANDSQHRPHTIFPWQLQQWEQIWRSYQAQRLPHALLLVGNVGMGKGQFAASLANALLCSAVNEKGEPCQVCHDCHLLRAQSHPSLLSIQPAQKGAAIKVDQIREAVEFVSQTALIGSYRIVIIQPAQAMNDFAANALLKTLEEPSSQTLIMLISEQSSYLPATIRSRCQRLTFLPPATDMALAWLSKAVSKKDGFSSAQGQLLLNLTQGAPLEAIRFVKEDILSFRQELFHALYALTEKKGDAIKYASQWQDVDIILILNFLFSGLMDIVRLQLHADPLYLLNSDQHTHLVAISEKISLQRIWTYLHYLQRSRREITMGIHLNKQLLLESLLIRWQEAA